MPANEHTRAGENAEPENATDLNDPTQPHGARYADPRFAGRYDDHDVVGSELDEDAKKDEKKHKKDARDDDSWTKPAEFDGTADDKVMTASEAAKIRQEELPVAPARELLNRHEESPAPDADHKPHSPKNVSKRGWKDTLKRAFSEFMDDGCTDLAAALTYHSVMSIFPMLIAVVSLLGVFGQGCATTDAALKMAADLKVPQDSLDMVAKFIDQMQGSGAAGPALIIGLLGALWSASNYVNAFSRATNTIYDVQEGRSMVKLRLWMLGVTAIILVLIVLVGLALVLTGPVAMAVGNVIGLGSTAVTVWNYAKWPVIAIVVMFVIALLYWATPNVRQPRMRWISPGSVIAFAVWALASALFGLYVANFGSYNKTYGALAGVIVFLLWLWLTNTVLLLGAEVDAELERSRQLEAGMPAETSLKLPLRGTATLEKKAEKEEKSIAAARDLRIRNATRLEQERKSRKG